MDKSLFKKAIIVAGVLSITSFSTVKYFQEKKRTAVNNYLFEHQANFFTKSFQLTKTDSVFLTNQLKPIINHRDVSIHAKNLIEYIDHHKAGVFSKDASFNVFDKFYSNFSKQLSKQKLDSLYPVLNKYNSFKLLEKKMNLADVLFKSKFRKYIYKKYLTPVKKKSSLAPFNTFTPKSYFTKNSSPKKLKPRKK